MAPVHPRGHGVFVSGDFVRSFPATPAAPGAILVALVATLSACGSPREGGGPGTAPSAAGGSAAAADLAGPLFVDATAESGLDFVHWNGMSGELYILEMMGPGAALFDYDGDGDLDLLLRQGTMLGPGKTLADAVLPPPPGAPPGDRLYRNDLEGHRVRWTDVTAGSGIDTAAAGAYGLGAAVGDYDGDGRPDLYLTNWGPNRLLKNRGDGTFENTTARAGAGDDRWSAAAVFFDYDGDGRLDLYVGNYIDFTFANHHTCFRASSARDYCGPLSYRPQPDRLLRNRGDGSFEDVTARSGLAGRYGNALAAVAFDADGDGRTDLYVANDAMENQLWMNRGDGTFVDEGLVRGVAINGDGENEGSMGIAVGDYDRDGDLDFFLTHMATETNTLYVADGGGWYHDGTLVAGLASPSRTSTGFGTGFVDVDNDGWLDLVAVNGAVLLIDEQVAAGEPLPLLQPDKLYRNLGGGRFAEVPAATAGEPFALAEVSRGAAFGDVDNDGDADVVVAHNAGPARLLLDRVGQDRPWLGLRLVGGSPPADRPGAVATLFRAVGPPLVRRAATDGSYLSANDPRVLFGLGDDDRVERLRVRWPGGSEEEFPPPPLGAYTTLVEGSGTPAPDPREGGAR